MKPMNSIKALRISDLPPDGLLASMQNTLDTGDDFESKRIRLLEFLATRQEELLSHWLEHKDDTIKKMAEELAAAPEGNRQGMIQYALDYLDRGVKELCDSADKFQRGLKRAEENTKTLSPTTGRKLKAIRQRSFQIITKQIEFFIFVKDHVRALDYEYAPKREKRPTGAIDATSPISAKNLHKWLMSDV